MSLRTQQTNENPWESSFTHLANLMFRDGIINQLLVSVQVRRRTASEFNLNIRLHLPVIATRSKETDRQGGSMVAADVQRRGSGLE